MLISFSKKKIFEISYMKKMDWQEANVAEHIRGEIRVRILATIFFFLIFLNEIF